MLAARHDWLLFSDADLSTPIEELKKFERELGGHQIVIASRAVRGARIVTHQPSYREYAGKLFNLFVQTIAVPGVHDTQCGFKLFSREAGRRLFAKQTFEGFSFDVEVLYLARKYGYSIAEIPVAWRNAEGTKVRFLRHGSAMIRDLFLIRLNDLRRKY